ncbi:MAG TPA: LamG domain-containing protein, partial [Methylomirabilota bacterium]|nr:LamG domain-containing protein [Methylomirabilota bacterium]
MLPATNPTQSRHPALWGGLLAAWSADMPGAGNRIVEPANQLHAIWAGQDQHPIVAGPGRRGFRFDGVNDTANAGNRLATSQRSIALWVMLSATAADAGLLTKASDSAFVSGTNTWGLFFDTNVVNTSLTNRFCFIERRINGVASNWAQVCSATQPVIGRWYHVVVVRGAGRTELYIDGARDEAYAQNTTSAPGSETAYNHHLGSFNGAGGWLSGRLAEVLLYARALSPAEVRMLASGASPLERRRPNVTLRTASGVTLSPTGIASGEAVGTPTVQPGAVTIT